jgi:excinuclease ABC subunit B
LENFCQSLVRHGFRLPSALDNRPLTDDEFWAKVSNAVFVSATPGDREMRLAALALPAPVSSDPSATSAQPSSSSSSAAVPAAAATAEGGPDPGGFVDMTIRPTNVLDPEIEIHPRKGQLPTLLQAKIHRRYSD